MSGSRKTVQQQDQAAGGRHGHSKAQCLQILRRLSAYVDDELTDSLCGEIRKHLGACPNCEEFVESLRQTVGLCRHNHVRSLSAHDKSRLRLSILKAAASA